MSEEKKTYLYRVYLKGGGVAEVEAENLILTGDPSGALLSYEFCGMSGKMLQQLSVREVAAITYEEAEE